jgi:integrase
MAALSDRFCANAPRGQYHDDLVRGLILLVRPAAKGKLRRSWVLRVTIVGKRKALGLGAFSVTGLAAARQKARDALRAIDEGKDPTRAGLRERTLIFDQACDMYLSDAAPALRSPKSEAILARVLRIVRERFGDRAVDRISPREIAALLKSLAPATGRRARTTLHGVFALAAVELEHRGVILRNPAAVDLLKAAGYVPPRAAAQSHHPAVDYRELPAFMAALGGIDARSARCLEFIILTAARARAARLCRHDQVDRDARIWRVPLHQMKDGAHRSGVFVVPLSDAALAAIGEPGGSPYVFAAANGEPISADRLITLTRILRRKGDWRDSSTQKSFTVHGFRSSFRSWAQAMRKDRELAELTLGHRFYGSVEASYSRDHLLDERRKLLDEWARHCAGQSAEVIPLRHGQ